MLGMWYFFIRIMACCATASGAGWSHFVVDLAVIGTRANLPFYIMGPTDLGGRGFSIFDMVLSLRATAGLAVIVPPHGSHQRPGRFAQGL